MGYHLHQKNNVLVFTIARPERRNAINYEVMDGLNEAVTKAENDDSIKIFMITGEGSAAFCAGGDLQEFHGLKTQQESYSMLSKMGAILYRLATLDKVTVAFINGTAVGGGCEIAAACDYRFARQGVKMGFVQGSLAITTGWGGGTLLYERLPANQAFRLLTEANILPGQTLSELGFIDQIVEAESADELIEMFGAVIEKTAPVLSAYKKMLTRKWIASDLKERMESEMYECSVLWEKEDHHEAVDRFLKK
ncbi:enoyl-CoA hydratase/isomerase family protein [Jeotgalibacillus haloalkalitolerans]|uniref:Enoyl-CoA hydratase/isomerase family protein n=1 Tax=Jeotgalibacillus haloalkalitolerans TaxID=3104292 RepID=A0ABU5KJV9_9BACL|nr:enoyl-CoA hydratase/isomerase family protein [Jeotgalibacillus sp. HH7-29]MDZ5711552.1 enoyl-CoA hydratase/isomerase family protein [Jeotgalibacillus sp. HH7-29]